MSIKEKLTEPNAKKTPISNDMFVSTGSVLLNLACTGKVKCGFAKGHYYNLIGDSESGKTWLSLSCMAEAAINENFDDYRFIFDDPEGGALMDFESFFGKAMADRLEAPAYDDDEEPLHSRTVEEFYYNVDDALSDGRPFIYVLDSMDAITDKGEQDKFQEHKTATREGKDTKGTYGMSKAKANSANLRTVTNRLPETGSILIIISQTRDNIQTFGFGKPKTRGGGHALKFYATLELWASVKKTLYKKYKGKDVQVGGISEVAVTKNRVSGRKWKVQIPFYHSHGIDDIGSMIDFLVEYGHWAKAKKGGMISAKEFDFKGVRDKIAEHIEDTDREAKLRNVVLKVWREIEKASRIKRKSRYG